jgi:hypothetical protein
MLGRTTKRWTTRGAVALTVIGTVMALTAGVALACYPTITATARCDSTGTVIIDYTSTAWPGQNSDDPYRANSRIDIAFDGVVVGTGAYAAPDYSFSGSAPAPAGKAPGDVVVVTATAVDSWGDGRFGPGASASVEVTVPDCLVEGDGRFTGGGNQIRVDGVRVTRGLTIHCDLLLSNNLEVNWGGNSFHMTEHLETVACTDDPAITQAPPPAPLDTLIGVGTGRYNNAAGYTVEFTLVDYGEPGSSDRMSIRIFQTSNPTNVVLDVPLQVLDGGNLQAHYDQPHS